MRKTILCAVILALLTISCTTQSQTGSLTIVANGEDFVRDGFTTNDGWDIAFEHVYVNVGSITAYQTDPPFDATSADMPEGTQVGITDGSLIDLKEPTAIMLNHVPVGHYNALVWSMDGDAIQMIGTAVKQERTVAFDITVDEAYSYRCGEYVGDERKGFVETDAPADIEMTFHFDHVFGDAGVAADETVNVNAFGFTPFAALAADDTLTTRTSDLQAQLGAEEYGRLMKTFTSLGHVGEGHCYEANHQ